VGGQIRHASGRHALSEHAAPVLTDLTDLAELGSVVGPALAPFSAAERLQDLVDAARQVFAAGACSIALLDEQEQNLVFEAASGRGADLVRGTVIPIGSGLAGWVVSSGQTLEISQVADHRFAGTSRSRPATSPHPARRAAGDPRRHCRGGRGARPGHRRRCGERDLVILALFARRRGRWCRPACSPTWARCCSARWPPHASDGLAEASAGRPSRRTDADLADLASLLARLQATGRGSDGWLSTCSPGHLVRRVGAAL
jgi:hypothetical protein